jgi:hypothetical protein
MDCNIFYRISSESQPKEKLPGANKQRCLDNFLRVFGRKAFFIADNCHVPLLKHLETLNLKLFETNLGNAGSLRHALELAMELPPDNLVYFVEDDYLHLQSAPQLLTEAINYVDYVTIYDHPDKYGQDYDGGEISKVFRTKSSHWRFTVSTTMTFATQVRTLREDYRIWLEGTKGAVPRDHEIFMTLGEQGRTLATSIPGAACHVDLAHSARIGMNTIEDWAINEMIGTIMEELDHKNLWKESKALMQQAHERGMTRLQQLACLAQLEKNIYGEKYFPSNVHLGSV